MKLQVILNGYATRTLTSNERHNLKKCLNLTGKKLLEKCWVFHNRTSRVILDQNFVKEKAANRWPLAEEGPDQFQASSHGICDGQSKSWTGFTQRTSLLTLLISLYQCCVLIR
jgi:hypothetical protein